MADRDRRRQEEQDGQAAEQSLQDDRAERRHAEPAHPAPRIDLPRPHGQDDRQEADRAGDQPVAVLVEDAADHLLEREREHEPAVVFGQSGTASPESVLVTMPPAAMSSTVEADDELDVAVEPDHGAAALNVKLTVFGFLLAERDALRLRSRASRATLRSCRCRAAGSSARTCRRWPSPRSTG